MPLVRITKVFSFEAAHALSGYDGPCRNIHGHSYVLHVCLSGKVNEISGMVMDFKILKKKVQESIVKKFDHSLIMKNNADFKIYSIPLENVILTPFVPTSENLVSDFASTIKEIIPEGVSLHHIRLYETAASFAEWYASDNE